METNITTEDILHYIEEARNEMESAINRFNNATTEPEIDIAIYSMIAAEKKINMLYKAAKEIIGWAK